MPEENYLRYFKDSSRAGKLPGANARGQASNPACGDIVVVELLFAGTKVVKAAYQAGGCSGAIAAASALAELVEGMELAEAFEIGEEDLMGLLKSMPASKQHGIGVALRALRRALETRRGGS